jgi:DNA mismatch repair protein MutS2
MPFREGEPVVVRGVGSGVVRDVRRGGRYLVAVGAATIVCPEDQLRAPKPVRKAALARHGPSGRTAAPAISRSGASATAAPEGEAPGGLKNAVTPASSLDLHGLTVEEALQLVDDRLNEALLAGVARLDIVHGKGHGKIRAALHRHLRMIPSVRHFELDARNPGVTHLHF